METIKFKLLHPNAKLPVRAHPTDACFDVVATSITVGEKYIEYGLGFATEIPEGWAGYFYPRSSVSEQDLLLCNGIGVIDSAYRGEWKARFRSTNMRLKYLSNLIGWVNNHDRYATQKYAVGDRVGQIRFAPLPFYDLALADELSDTSRGTGGFGSTGV